MEETSQVNVFEFLELCGAIELAAARLYYHFGNLHRADPELEAVWRKAAREEENHAAQFNLAKAGNASMVAGTTLTMSDVLAMKRRIDEIVREALASPPPPSKALSLAIDLEAEMAQFHSVTALIFADRAQQRLFKAMMSADKDHVEALRRALESHVARFRDGP